MISGKVVFAEYQAVFKHFTTTYDYIKYQGKLSSGLIDSYDTRREKYIFEKIGRKMDSRMEAFEFCVANFATGNTKWLYGDFAASNAVYTNWKKYFGSFTYIFGCEQKILMNLLDAAKSGFNDYVQTDDAYDDMISRLSKESICVLDNRFNFLKIWQDKYSKDPLKKRKIGELIKYKPLCMLKVESLKVD